MCDELNTTCIAVSSVSVTHLVETDASDNEFNMVHARLTYSLERVHKALSHQCVTAAASAVAIVH